MENLEFKGPELLSSALSSLGTKIELTVDQLSLEDQEAVRLAAGQRPPICDNVFVIYVIPIQLSCISGLWGGLATIGCLSRFSS